jgi:hypothetical protein
LWLTNEAAYLSPADDPWFRALTPVNITNYAFNGGAYTSDPYVTSLPASPMACTERYQWGKDIGKVCPKLTGSTIGGLTAIFKAVPEQLDHNQRQVAIFNRIYNSTWNSDMYSIASSPNSNTLLAIGPAAEGALP